MKKYFLLSCCVHITVIVAYFSSTESEQIIDKSSLETVTFDLGLLAAPVESLEVTRTNSKAQQQQTADATASSNAKPKMTTPPEKLPEKNKKREVSKPQHVKAIDTKTDKKLEKVKTDSSKLVVAKALPNIDDENKTQEIDNTLTQKTSPSEPANSKSTSSARTNLGMKESSQASVEDSSIETQQATGGKATESKKQNANSASYIAQLQRRISQQAARTYPRKAKRKRQEGVVKVAFIIHSSGKITDIKVVTSSDYLLLDKAAIKAVQRVGKYNPLPEGINPNFEIPIRFSLL